MTAPNTKRRARNCGFTLIELLVVVGIIMIVLGIAIPSIANLFRSGAEVQARNLIDAQISAARMLAVRNRGPVALHFQQGYEIDGRRDYYMAILEGNNDNWPGIWEFTLVPGTTPARLPGGLIAGRVDDSVTDSSGNYSGVQYTSSSARNWFTNFSIAFDASGRLTTMKVRVIPSTVVGYDPPEDTDIWRWGDVINSSSEDNWRGQYSIRALCLFDPDDLDGLNDSEADDYLNDNARFLPVAPYTGGLIQSVQD